MSNQYDNALEAVRSAVVNAAQLGLTKPEITDAVSRALHTNNHPWNGRQPLADTRSNNPFDILQGHYPLPDDGEL